MRRWLIGIAFFVVVLTAGIVMRATDYGEVSSATITTAEVSTSTTLTATGSTAGESTTSTTEEPQTPTLEPGADDALVLEQPEAPRVAGIDYDAFPTGADPSGPAGVVYHVAVEGDDAAEGSEAQPFATIDHALAAAVDGDSVVVHSGLYVSAGLSVTQSRFLLTDAGDGEVVVEAATTDAGYGLAVSSPGQHDVKVRGLRFTGFDTLGIRCGNPTTVERVVLEDLVVEGALEGMAGYFDVRGVVVDGLLVRRVSMLGIGRAGVRFGDGGGRNVRIVGLHVGVTGAGGGEASADQSEPDGIVFGAGDNVVVENSIVEGVRGDGIDLLSARSAVVSVIVRHVAGSGVVLHTGGDLVNALVFDTGGDAQLVTGAGSYRVVNCTFAYHARGGPRSYAAAFAPNTVEEAVDVSVLNTLFYQQPGPVFLPGRARLRMENSVFWGFPGALVDWGVREWGEADLSLAGPDNLALEPGLVDPLRGDFHPGVGSPLFAAGGRTEETPGSDLLGAPRVESVTVGAFQTTRAGAQRPTGSTSTTSAATPDGS